MTSTYSLGQSLVELPRREGLLLVGFYFRCMVVLVLALVGNHLQAYPLHCPCMVPQPLLVVTNDTHCPIDQHLSFLSDDPRGNDVLSSSVARQWNEVMLEAIRRDYTRPAVHARNLFHFSIAVYDAWAVYAPQAQTYMLGKTVNNHTCQFDSVSIPDDIASAQNKAISYAAYRLLTHRFAASPNAEHSQRSFDKLMRDLGYDPNLSSIDYHNNDPATLGNFIGWSVITMGLSDGANEGSQFKPTYYKAVNAPLVVKQSGNPAVSDPNRWQPLKLDIAVDQNGNLVAGTQNFQSPEWGNVTPFALQPEDASVYQRDGHAYRVYLDPGPVPVLDTMNADNPVSQALKWNIALVAAWAAHHNPADGVLWDISPSAIGNLTQYPTSLSEYNKFYNFSHGGDIGKGHPMNPTTQQPYAPNKVLRGDYARVLAAYWADGPNSETPPGHWFTLLNEVVDHPDFQRKMEGQGEPLNALEWDVKAYLVLGGALHDAAIAAWSVKGWYDAARPLPLFRYMAAKGQCSDPSLPSYHPAGLPLIDGFIELVKSNDKLAQSGNQSNVGKLKVYSWAGHQAIRDKDRQIAGADWLLAEDWCTFQKETFVSPPFAGYVSGHSTFSRAAAEVLTLLTGDAFFPGGMYAFTVPKDSKFLQLEKGPSTDVTLQWATYIDAADQCALSRIWGGLHPPYDDIPGRIMGQKIGQMAFVNGKSIFQKILENEK